MTNPLPPLHYLALLLCICFTPILRAQPFTNIRATQTMTIRSMVEDEQHCIWFASGKSIYRFDGKEIRTYSHEVLDELGAINTIALSGRKLLVGSERGMAEMSLQDGDCQSVGELKGRNVRSLLLAHGHEWAGTDSLLYRDRKAMDKVMNVQALCAADSDILIGGRLGVIRQDCEGKILDELRWDNPAFVTSLSIDESGDILIGTAFALLRMDKNFCGFTSNIFYCPVVKCMMRDPRGVLLMGCDGGLFECIEKAKPIRHDARDPRSFAGNVVWSMLKDHAGNLWIGSDNGLSVLTSDQSFVINSLPSITESGQGNQIYCMLQDKHDRLWIGGTNGIVRVDNFAHNDQHHVWYERDNANQRLPHNRIRMFYEDPVWGVWACTDGGLLHYNESLEQWDRYIIPEDPQNWVYSVERDEDALVVNTFDGVYRLTLDEETAELLRLQRIDAQPSLDYAYGKVQIGDNEWSLTSNGLVVKKGSSERCFELSEKFISIYYNAGDDRIFLGGADQFAIIRPREFLNCESHGLWFNPDARFADDTEHNSTTLTRVMMALCTVVVLFLILSVLYARQRSRLRAERMRRTAMLKSAAEKMATLEQDNSTLHQQLRQQQYVALRRADESAAEDDESFHSADEQYIMRVNRAIEENIDNPDFSVAMLSNIMGVSSKQLYRRIKQYTDLTTVEYIRKVRLQKASVLLSTPSFTINEVMYMVGFSNPSYFTRSFAGEFGMTPTEFRQKRSDK